MRNEISNSDDIIDSRDVIARIEELETEIADAHDDSEANDVLDLKAELDALKELASEAEGYAPDWHHGATLIRDSYFVEAMEELCKDIGDMPREIPSYFVIDWEATARNLQVDYTSVDFDGVTYWVR